MSAPHVAILGGGISGLTAAYVLRRCARAPLRVTLIEQSPRLGGWLHSFRSDGGFLFEAGGRGLRPRNGGIAGLRIVEDLGLQPFVLTSSASATSRFVYRGGSLQPVPSSALAAIFSPLLRPVILSVWRDILQRPCPDADESVDSFVARHLGRHAADVLFNALLGGIYAGDSSRLSVRSVFPALWEMQQERGSLAAAAVAQALGGSSGGAVQALKPAGAASALFSEALGPSSSPFLAECARATSVSFTHGVSTLTHALEHALLRRGGPEGPPVDAAGRQALWPHEDLAWLQREPGAAASSRHGYSEHGCELNVHTGARVAGLRLSARGGVDILWSLNGGAVSTLQADRVICALPASALAGILEESASEAGAVAVASVAPFRDAAASTVSALRSIPYASIAAVNIAWHGAVKDSATAGFGYLVPACERLSGPLPGVLGMVFDSDSFPGQAADFAGDAVRLAHASAAGPDSAEADVRSRWPKIDPNTRVTVMVGGATWPEVERCSSEQLASIALQAARDHLGITSEPCEVVVNLASSAIPQYNVGHHVLTAAAEKGAEELFGGRLQLIGNSYKGVGISDCLSGAIAAAEQALDNLLPSAASNSLQS